MPKQVCITAFIAALVALSFAVAGADECDSLFDAAHSFAEAASSAFDQENYESAERLYNEAVDYYNQVAARTDCSCPKIAGAAASNSTRCSSNARTSRANLERKQEYERKMKEREAKLQAQKPQEKRSNPQHRDPEKQINQTYGALLGSVPNASALLLKTGEETPPDK